LAENDSIKVDRQMANHRSKKPFTQLVLSKHYRLFAQLIYVKDALWSRRFEWDFISSLLPGDGCPWQTALFTTNEG
jgi:hypothetical protein